MDGDAGTPRRLRPLRPIEPRPARGRLSKRPPAGERMSGDHQRRLETLKRQIAEGLYVPDPEIIAREIIRQGLDRD